MATTVTFKLNKPAHQFQAGESVGFAIRGGVKYYDRQEKVDKWTNYEAVAFAKSQGQIAFYQSALVEGCIVEVTGQQQAIKQFQGQNGLLLSIELLDAKIGFVSGGNGGQQQQQPAQRQQQQPQYQQPAPQRQPQQSAPQQSQYSEPPMNFDSDIPF